MNKISVKPRLGNHNDNLLKSTPILKYSRYYFIPNGAFVNSIKLYQLQDSINNFKYLEKDWDSYNANSISATSIEKALELISQLINDNIYSKIPDVEINVFPMRDGGIQFEFDSNYLCSELEISPDGQMHFLQFDGEGNLVNKTSFYEISGISYYLEEIAYVR